MRFEAAVTGIGWVGADTMGYPGAVKRFECADRLPRIRRKDVLDKPYKPFGRMDDYSTLGFCAIAFALADAGIKRDSHKKNIGLVAATTTGCTSTDAAFWQTVLKGAPSPALFAYTLDSCFLGEAAICFGLTGETTVINERQADGRAALYFALEQIGTQGARAMVCGICNSAVQYRPDRHNRPAPGALFFVLENQKSEGYLRLWADTPETIQVHSHRVVDGLYGLARLCCPDVEIIF